MCWTALCIAWYLPSLLPTYKMLPPPPVIIMAKNNSVVLKSPQRAGLLWLIAIGTRWSLQSISSLRSVTFLPVFCIFTVRENTLRGKNPLCFGRFVKCRSFFMPWPHHHCHLEDFLDLTKHGWLLWSTLDPAYSFSIAAAILLSLPESVLPLHLRLELFENIDCALFILCLQ